MPTVENAIMSMHFSTKTDPRIACPCCSTMLINPDVVKQYQMLEEFREWYGRSMYINSGYRCPRHNKQVKGEPNSFHMKALANDIQLPEEFKRYTAIRKREFLINIRKKWFEICDKYGVAGGSGFYNTFFHLDSRPTGRATWDESEYFKN